MKKFIPAILWITMMSALLWSCSDETEVPSVIDETLDVRTSFVANSSAALNQLRNNGLSGPLGAMFGTRYGNNGRINETPSSMMRARINNTDSTEISYCFTETWEDDGQGNYRFILDFGNGCDYYGEYLYGKLEEIGSYTDTSFAATVTYTNFGGSDQEGSADWWIDGTHAYVGTWSALDFEPTDDTTEYWDTYQTTYQFQADLTQTYIEYIGAPEDSVTTGEEIYIIDYVANGIETMNESGYTVNERSEQVSANTGESYTSTVDSPLFIDFSCEDDVWIYVSGIESGSYQYEGETGSYSIDYGEGTCDNLVIITENGVSEEIDLGEEWNDWEEECGDGHDNDEDGE